LLLKSSKLSKVGFVQVARKDREMATPEKANSIPPYVGWGVFKNTIDTLAQSVVPTGPLDRRVLHFMSGADHGALISALRFLGLADANKVATQEYRDLVKDSANETKFKEEMRRLLETRYSPILGKLNLQHGTISELERAFKDHGVAQGQMLTKTTRFLIKALQECGVDVSPHISKPSPKVRSAANRPVAEKKAKTAKHTEKPGGSENGGGNGDVPPTGFERMPIPGIPSAFIQYPSGLTNEQCALFGAAITFLKAYVTGKDSVGKGGQP
jgi:hypothetical protein